MIYSMTGYGVAGDAGFRIEIRSVNHKHLDIQLKLPPSLYAAEQRLKDRIRKRLSRGRLDVFVKPLKDGGASLRLNHDAARRVYDGLSSIQEELGVPGTIDIATLASIREIYEPVEVDESAVEMVGDLLEKALDQLDDMRLAEGLSLKADLTARIDAIEGFFKEIAPYASEHSARVRADLKERIDGIGLPLPVEDARLAQEIFFYAERADITEELVRAASHVSQFRGFIDGGGGVGRKLDFLTQELFREANTIASKAGRSEIAHIVIEIKDQLEKVREQLQNIQ